MTPIIDDDVSWCSGGYHLSCSFSTDSLGSLSPRCSKTDDVLEESQMDLSSLAIHLQYSDNWSLMESDGDNSVSSDETEEYSVEFDAVIIHYSPLDVLNEVRLSEYNSHVNGVDSELDDTDMYLISNRQKLTLGQFVPVRSVRNLNNRSSPRPVPQSDCGYFNSRKKPNSFCVFCKNNGESLSVYGGHGLKGEWGRTTCPVLRRYTCPKCGASGDSAHTIKYCPLVSVWEKMKNIHEASSLLISDGKQAGLSS